MAVPLCATLSGLATSDITFTLATVSGTKKSIPITKLQQLMVHIGTATEGSDFTAVSMSLTYPMGTTDGANDQCIDVTSLVDDVFEGDETFTVELTGATSTADMTTVTITDNDGQFSSVEFH